MPTTCIFSSPVKKVACSRDTPTDSYLACFLRLCSCLQPYKTGVPWGFYTMVWVMNQRNESTTRYRTRSSYSMLSLATTLTCSHDCMLEHAGGWTTICCERGDRVEPFGTAGAKGRAPRKAPAKPLPRGEGWEDRSRPLALLQLGLMLAHFVGVCRVLPVVTSFCKLVRSCAP